MIEDSGYKIITPEEAADLEKAGTIRKITPEEMAEIGRQRLRLMIYDMAEVIYKAEAPILVPPPFDKNDPSCQKYIRMAEAVVSWMRRP